LKKGAGYALFRTLMGIGGKDPAEIFKSIILRKVRRAEGLSLLKNGRVTYVTNYGVAERQPDFGH
jgi:hypothetical protein